MQVHWKYQIGRPPCSQQHQNEATGVEMVIDERILQPDPTTRITHQEATLIVAEQELGFVERQLTKSNAC